MFVSTSVLVLLAAQQVFASILPREGIDDLAFSLPIPSECEARCERSHSIDPIDACGPSGCHSGRELNEIISRDLRRDIFGRDSSVCNQTYINDLADCIGCIAAYNSTVDVATEQSHLNSFTTTCAVVSGTTVSDVTITPSKSSGSTSSSNKPNWSGRTFSLNAQQTMFAIMGTVAAALLL
ncbi:hypothetical protein C8J56DRAFT_190786 [Mycena floridula]|nr:hypothetical protein C8J56DRAFT_190786 [Mycena floridula]